ncbi:MAG: hypothetical protein WHV66_10000, partial [Anaerolineales bacterium]
MPLLWLSLAFLLGVVLADALAFSLWLWLGLTIMFVLLAVFDRRLRNRLTLLMHWRKYSPLPLGVILATLAFG